MEPELAEVLDTVLVRDVEEVVRPRAHNPADRDVHVRARVDAVEIVLIVHPTEALLEDKQRSDAVVESLMRQEGKGLRYDCACVRARNRQLEAIEEVLEEDEDIQEEVVQA